ncbi:hypothetical protein [Pseudomonas sp. NFX15]|uniref:hypothetical protein n=1 Tax=Pseudomonas sp. NFX15 TaxID=2816958 RepID=UPI003B8E7BC7
MRKYEKMFGAVPGSQLEELLNKKVRTVEIWDTKTGIHNIQQHIEHRGDDLLPYDVISAGLRGELNGVLPHRANEFSILISEGKFPIARDLTFVNTKGLNIFKMDIYRQSEIYRQAGVPLPDAFRQGMPITVIKNANKIRFEAG